MSDPLTCWAHGRQQVVGPATPRLSVASGINRGVGNGSDNATQAWVSGATPSVASAGPVGCVTVFGCGAGVRGPAAGPAPHAPLPCPAFRALICMSDAQIETNLEEGVQRTACTDGAVVGGAAGERAGNPVMRAHARSLAPCPLTPLPNDPSCSRFWAGGSVACTVASAASVVMGTPGKTNGLLSPSTIIAAISSLVVLGSHGRLGYVAGSTTCGLLSLYAFDEMSTGCTGDLQGRHGALVIPHPRAKGAFSLVTVPYASTSALGASHTKTRRVALVMSRVMSQGYVPLTLTPAGISLARFAAEPCACGTKGPSAGQQ